MANRLKERSHSDLIWVETAESAVSTVIAERIRWRMCWSEKDDQAFIQVRCGALNVDFGKHFNRGYPHKPIQQENQDVYLRAG